MPTDHAPCEDTLQAVYERLGGTLYRLAAAITGERQAAEDAVQEAFVRVWARRASLREPGKLDRYLTRAVRNRALDLRRAARRESPSDDVQILARGGGAGPDVERIERALFALPLEQREVVLLRVYEGYAFKEIAARTESALGTVHSRYRYALERLRSLLEGCS